MNLQTIERLIKLFENSEIECLEFAEGEQLLRVSQVPLAVPSFSAQGQEAVATTVRMADEVDKATTVVSPSTGIFSQAHPLSAPIETHSMTERQAGDVIGFLQVGPLLSAIFAPAAGRTIKQMVPDGTLVGYGTELLQFATR